MRILPKKFIIERARDQSPQGAVTGRRYPCLWQFKQVGGDAGHPQNRDGIDSARLHRLYRLLDKTHRNRAFFHRIRTKLG